MPSSVTHKYFCDDVYSKLNSKIKKKLNSSISLMRIASQGPDPYFFYDFHLTPKARKIFKIDEALHHYNINEHFLSLINYINDNNYYSKDDLLAYLYGQICHFALDTTLHPYVVYMTGNYQKGDKSTYKYNGLHEDMEYFIDRYMIWKREKIPPRRYKMYKTLFDIKPFSIELKDMLDTVYMDVYGFNNVSKIYYKSIRDMKSFYYVFNYDRFGIKKFIYTVMDLLGGNFFVKKKELSFYNSYNDKLSYLNKDKDEWNHPTDINERYNYSFTELYVKAMDKAIKIIEEIDDMIENNKIDDKKICNLFGNLDYGTGKDYTLGLINKYYRF